MENKNSMEEKKLPCKINKNPKRGRKAGIKARKQKSNKYVAMFLMIK